MGRQLDSDVRVVVKHRYEGVKCMGTGWQQACLAKLIEDIIYEHRNGDICQREEQRICLRFLHVCRNAYLLLMIQETVTGAENDIVSTRLCNIFERTVTLHERMLVGAVAAHDICLSILKSIAVHLVYPSLDKLYHFRILKPPYMVVSPAIIA